MLLVCVFLFVEPMKRTASAAILIFKPLCVCDEIIQCAEDVAHHECATSCVWMCWGMCVCVCVCASLPRPTGHTRVLAFVFIYVQ